MLFVIKTSRGKASCLLTRWLQRHLWQHRMILFRWGKFYEKFPPTVATLISPAQTHTISSCIDMFWAALPSAAMWDPAMYWASSIVTEMVWKLLKKMFLFSSLNQNKDHLKEGRQSQARWGEKGKICIKTGTLSYEGSRRTQQQG